LFILHKQPGGRGVTLTPLWADLAFKSVLNKW